MPAAYIRSLFLASSLPDLLMLSVLGSLYRPPLAQYDTVMRTVCGLVNLRTYAR